MAASRRSAGTRRRPPRAAYHHGDLPRALRRAARTLLADGGADAFTLRAAARAVGVSHAAAYRHFADKRALLAALAEDGYAELTARMRRAARGRPDPFERVRRAAGAFVAFALEEPALFRLMTGPRLNADGRFPSLERALGDAVDVLAAPLRDAQAAGRVRRGSLTDPTLGLVSLLHGYAQLVLARRIRVRPSAVGAHVATLVDPLLQGLRTR